MKAGKKPAPPAAGGSKKQKVEGGDITRFFDPRPAQAHQEQQEGPARDEGAGGRLVSPAAAAPLAAEDRCGAAAAPGPALHKHLSVLQDLVPADSFALSQDTDAMQVVWGDSPGASSQPMARSLSNLGRSVGYGTQEFNAIKQRLISAAQKPRDVRRPGHLLGGGGAGAVGGSTRLQQSEQFLEGLLARHLPTAAGGLAAAAAAHQGPADGVAPEHSNHSGGPLDVGAGGVQKTPATHLRGILKRRGSAGRGGKQTPASSVKFSLNDSTSKGGRPRAGGHQVGSSGKKRQAGQKRKALLELLEQVESIVHSSGSPAEQEDREEDEGQEDAGVAGEDAEVAAAEAAAQEAAAVSDKENAADAAGNTPPGSQGQAGAAAGAGPTGSQQLMPPPGGVHCCGGQQPAKPAMQQQPQRQGPVASGAAVKAQQEGRPTAATRAGPPAHPPQQHAPAPARQQAQQQQVAPPPKPGGFGCSGGFADEEDEDDLLMAQLELQLLTQVEQRQAAARQAAVAGGPAHAAKQAAARGHGQAPAQAPGRTAAVQLAPPAAAAQPRLQAAPPAAQHPASQQQQQQQRQQQAASARQLPRSPYDKGPQAALPGAAAGPAGVPAGAAPPQAAPPAAQPAGGQLVAAAAQGSDGWDDDFDVDLLDQFEAAALKERADRSLNGNPSSSGSGGSAGQQQQPVVAQAGAPPSAPAAAGPLYPGNREEVHYQIKEIFLQPHEQILLLYNKYKDRQVYAHLQAPWADLPYRVGDTVNVLAQLDLFEGHYHCLLKMDQGMLILHPDVLLSGTRITTSHECPRRSFLDERVAGDGSNDKAVKGTLQHNLIQAALVEGLRTPQQLHVRAERIVAEATESLLEVELSEEAAMQCLKQAVPGILRWMNRFLRADPAPDALLGAGMDYNTGKDIRRKVAVPEVIDIEESIWSTKFGVKGMIDVSAKLALEDLGQVPRGGQQPGGAWMQAAAGAGRPQAPGAGPGREVTMGPVEIKTGKAHDSHRAQVLLYLLLMEERYGRPLDWGMLWYTTQSDPQLVMKRPSDLACLMAVRNRLAAAIFHKEMPPLSDEKRQCNWCFQQLNCALAHKAEKGAAAATPDSFVRPMGDRGGNLDRVQQELAGKYDRAAGHMTPADCEFLRKWEQLVTLEEAHSTARRPEIWSMAGRERQALGRCLAGLTLSHVDEEQLLYTFCLPGGGAIECNFQEGEMLLLSVEGQHAAVARGFFYTCTATHLTISLNKALRKGLLKPGGTPPDAAAAGGGAALFDRSVRWRLDRDEASSTFVRLRGNLFALFRREFQVLQNPETRQVSYGAELAQSQQAAKLRRLVVELAPPQYDAPDPTQPDPTPPGMNSEQHEAVRRVLAARDYTLVLGMPGAGKTTTIVSMVQALVAQGKSVLLTSYTNSAVDNILMKLAREEVPFIRLGREAGVHPAVRPWVPGGERYPRKTTRELARLADSVPVFGATCFGVHHAMLKDKLFDVCIIDEAGQMVLPASLGPLLKGRSFVLVGDHNQLPPLVTCKEAEAGGLGESLFKRLSEAHPQAVVSLPVQYRMAADIMLLPNVLIYKNALRCGTDGIAQASLQLPAPAAAVLGTLPAWLQAALDPQRRVLFLDTAQVEGARETVAGDAVSNSGEAQLVLRLLQAAITAGVAQEQLGIICPYRSQVALLDRLAKEARLEEVEVLTVDKCQGRDKDCILLSLVRSNAEAEAGKLLADWRRINVAITRAKKKLVLVGDSGTLRCIPLFAQLLALVQERGWLLPLPPTALQ